MCMHTHAQINKNQQNSTQLTPAPHTKTHTSTLTNTCHTQTHTHTILVTHTHTQNNTKHSNTMNHNTMHNNALTNTCRLLKQILLIHNKIKPTNKYSIIKNLPPVPFERRSALSPPRRALRRGISTDQSWPGRPPQRACRPPCYTSPGTTARTSAILCLETCR